jgi:hypothetical protein
VGSSEGSNVAIEVAARSLDVPGPASPALPAVRGRRQRRWELYFLALLATYVYALLGWWLKYRYHFTIGDSLARTNDAKAMIFSRDPHAAAIGVYWMPLPTIVQLPFVAILEPLRHVELAGPLSTACFGGGTVLVLGKMCRDLGLSRLTGFLIPLAYAVNPVIAYFSANGMSESAEFFFIALALWGLLRFLRDDKNSSAVLTAVGLTGLAMSKYEAAPMIVLIALVLVFLHIRKLPRGQWHETALNVSIIVLPAVFFVGCWLIYQKLILGSFFAFMHVSVIQGSDARAEVHGLAGSAADTTRFVGHWVFLFFPAAALVVPALFLPGWRKMLGGFAVAATGVLAILATGYYIYAGHSVGQPRYFAPVIVVGTIAVIVIAARLPSKSISHWLIDPAAIAAILIAAWSGAYAEASNHTSVENEQRVFQLVNGRYDNQPDPSDSTPASYQAAHKMDSLLEPGDRVFVDERYDPDMVLFSYKPDQIVTNSDRDYEQLASPTGIDARIGWAIVPHSLGRGLDITDDDGYLMVHRQAGWTEVWHNGRIEIWQRSAESLRGLPMPPRG